MWIVPTKKEIRKSFVRRDQKIEQLENKLLEISLKLATLEGSQAVLLSRYQYQAQASVKKSLGGLETNIMQKIRTNKKALVTNEIIALMETHATQEAFNIIVREKGLCSKASFYRYLSGLKYQGIIKTKTTSEVLGVVHDATGRTEQN